MQYHVSIYFFNPFYLVGFSCKWSASCLSSTLNPRFGDRCKARYERRDILYGLIYIYIGRSSEIIDDNERPIRYTCLREDTKISLLNTIKSSNNNIPKEKGE